MREIDFKRWQLNEKPSIKKQFKYWLKLQKEDPRQWKHCDFESKDIVLLVRNYTNDVHQPCLTIATVHINKRLQNKGVFKSLLNYLVEKSPWDIIAIEDVKNPILKNVCIKYGFDPISKFFPNSYRIHKNKLPKFNVEKFNY